MVPLTSDIRCSRSLCLEIVPSFLLTAPEHILMPNASWKIIIICFSLNIAGLGSHLQTHDNPEAKPNLHVPTLPSFPCDHLLVYSRLTVSAPLRALTFTSYVTCFWPIHPQWSGWTDESLGGLCGFSCEGISFLEWLGNCIWLTIKDQELPTGWAQSRQKYTLAPPKISTGIKSTRILFTPRLEARR